MVEKSKGKIITGTLSIVAAALVFISYFGSLISNIMYGSFSVYLVLNVLFFLGGIALLVLSIVGLILFSDKRNRKVGMSSVIIFAGLNVISLIETIILSIVYGGVILNIWGILCLIISVGLLIAFFVCHSKFPVGESNAQQSNGINGVYAFPATQQPAENSAPNQTTDSAANNADEINKV